MLHIEAEGDYVAVLDYVVLGFQAELASGFGAFYVEETFEEPKTLYYYVRENGLLVDPLLAD